MFAGCSDECIKAIIKARQGKGAYPYTNSPNSNSRPIPKRPINLQIKEPISIKPTQKFVITPSIIESKKTTDTELYNKNINTKLDKDQSIHTGLDEKDKEISDIELKSDNIDIPKTWYNISIFSKHFT